MEIFPGRLFSVILTYPFKIYPSFSWSVIEISVSKSGTEDVCYSSFHKISRYYTTIPQCLLPYIDGLVQDCSDSTVNALELLQSSTKPVICVTITTAVLWCNNWNETDSDSFDTPTVWCYDDAVEHYWPFVRGIHRSPVDGPQRGPWCFLSC